MFWCNPGEGQIGVSMPKVTHWICDKCGLDEVQRKPPGGWVDVDFRSVYIRRNINRGPDENESVPPSRYLLCGDCKGDVENLIKGE